MLNYLRDERVSYLICLGLLVVVGIIFVYSTSAFQMASSSGDYLYIFKKHLLSIALGFALLVLAYKIPLNFYRRLVPVIFIATIGLLILPYFFAQVNGAHRWINLYVLNFQPSELAKFTIVLYLAHYLTKKEEKLQSFVSGFLPASILLGVMTSLILAEPDFGTTFIFAMLTISMFIVGGMKFSHVIGVISFAVPVLLTGLLSVQYRTERLLTFLDPWPYKNGVGWQLIQSLAAVGSGGVSGEGLGNSMQKLSYLPEAHNDFIFAIISEELGFIGAALFILVVFMMLKIGIDIAYRQTDKFRFLLTFGISFIIFLQSIMHIFVVLGLMPTKGITLPFVSYGGSSMMVFLFLVGVMLRASEENMEEQTKNFNHGSEIDNISSYERNGERGQSNSNKVYESVNRGVTGY